MQEKKVSFSILKCDITMILFMLIFFFNYLQKEKKRETESQDSDGDGIDSEDKLLSQKKTRKPRSSGSVRRQRNKSEEVGLPVV